MPGVAFIPTIALLVAATALLVAVQAIRRVRLRVATKLQALIGRLALPNPSAPGGGLLTASVGVATATPALDSNWEELELVASAQHALEAAKEAGRNRIVPAST